MGVSVTPRPDSDPELAAFRHQLFGAMIASDKAVHEHEILRRILYQTVHRYCENDNKRHAKLAKAVANGRRVPTELRRELQRIAFEDVIPKLSPEDRSNLERTLRSRSGLLPDRRPPSYPMNGRLVGLPRGVPRELDS